MKSFVFSICLIAFGQFSILAQSDNCGLYFYFEDAVYGGYWDGEIKYINGKPYAHGYGTFICKNETPGYQNQVLRYTGEVYNGKMDGYGVYSDNIGAGGFLEGNWYDGLPNGKMAIKTNDGSYIAGDFRKGKLYGRVDMKTSSSRIIKMNCDGLDLLSLINGKYGSGNFPCENIGGSGSELIGAALLIAVLIPKTSKHASLDRIFNCAAQLGVSSMIENPAVAGAASEAVNSFLSRNKYSWKNMAENTTQNYLSAELKRAGHANLASSANFLSYLSCVLDDSK